MVFLSKISLSLSLYLYICMRSSLWLYVQDSSYVEVFMGLSFSGEATEISQSLCVVTSFVALPILSTWRTSSRRTSGSSPMCLTTGSFGMISRRVSTQGHFRRFRRSRWRTRTMSSGLLSCASSLQGLPLSLRLKIAQKPYIIWSALRYEALEP